MELLYTKLLKIKTFSSKKIKIPFSFKSPRFFPFSLNLDVLTSKKIVKLGETVCEKLYEIRNGIIQALLDYEAGLITKSETITKLISLIIEFNSILRVKSPGFSPTFNRFLPVPVE